MTSRARSRAACCCWRSWSGRRRSGSAGRQSARRAATQSRCRSAAPSGWAAAARYTGLCTVLARRWARRAARPSARPCAPRLWQRARGQLEQASLLPCGTAPADGRAPAQERIASALADAMQQLSCSRSAAGGARGSGSEGAQEVSASGCGGPDAAQGLDDVGSGASSARSAHRSGLPALCLAPFNSAQLTCLLHPSRQFFALRLAHLLRQPQRA